MEEMNVGDGGPGVDENGLIEALADDLDGNFERLIERFQDHLYGFAVHLTACPQDAEEIAQETFIRAYRALERYPPERVHALVPRPWLHRIALNVFRNRVRGRHPSVVSFDAFESEPEFFGSADEDGPVTRAERHETRETLRALVLGIPDRYRVPLVLRHVEGMSYLEIAAALGQPVGTVKSNVHRGVGLLRATLRKTPELASAMGRGKE